MCYVVDNLIILWKWHDKKSSLPVYFICFIVFFSCVSNDVITDETPFVMTSAPIGKTYAFDGDLHLRSKVQIALAIVVCLLFRLIVRIFVLKAIILSIMELWLSRTRFG